MWELIRQFSVFNFPFLQGIFDRIDQILTFWVFLTIGLLSGGFLLLTMLLGEVSEIFSDLFGHSDLAMDHDVSHDISGADHDTGHEVGHDHEASHDSSNTAGISTPSVFSFRIILSFLCGFGVIGAIAAHLGNSAVISSLYGLGTGMVMAALSYMFVLFLASQQASVNITAEDFVGKQARVIVSIPADGLGQVQIDTGVGSITKLSRSTDHLPISENSMVRIESISGQTALVTKVL